MKVVKLKPKLPPRRWLVVIVDTPISLEGETYEPAREIRNQVEAGLQAGIRIESVRLDDVRKSRAKPKKASKR